jgi:hypothetical protein
VLQYKTLMRLAIVTSRELREELRQDVDHLEREVRCHGGDTCKRSQEHRGRMSGCIGISMSVENRARPGAKRLWRVNGSVRT